MRIAENIKTFFITQRVHLFEVTACHPLIVAVLNTPVRISKNDMRSKSPRASFGSSRYVKKNTHKVYQNVFNIAMTKSVKGEKNAFVAIIFSIINKVI